MSKLWHHHGKKTYTKKQRVRLTRRVSSMNETMRRVCLPRSSSWWWENERNRNEWVSFPGFDFTYKPEGVYTKIMREIVEERINARELMSVMSSLSEDVEVDWSREMDEIAHNSS
jgi:hypothetical protein